MQSLRDWTLTLSLVTIAGALVGVLAGQGQGRRALRVLCGVVILYTAVLPLQNLAGGALDFEALFPDEAAQEQQLLRQSEQTALLAAETALQTEIQSLLRQNGFDAVSVTVRCEVRADGIAPVGVTLSGKWNRTEKEEIRRLLKPFLQEKTTLSFLAEETDGD